MQEKIQEKFLDFLDNSLTTFFGVRKFANTSALSVTFFLKKFKI